MTNRHAGIWWKGPLFLLVALGLLAAACAPAAPAPTPTAPPAATPKPAAPTATPAPKKLGKLRYGAILPGFSVAYFDMDIEKGFLKEEGFEEVEVLRASSSDLQKALLAGQLDIAVLSPGLAFPSVEQGADLIIFATWLYPRDLLFVKKDINKVKDLEGRIYANTTPGSQSDQFIRAIMDKYKVDVQKVNMVLVGNDAARMSALFAGKADATLAGIDNLAAVEKTPDLKSLLSVREELPGFLASGLTVPGKLAREKPEVVQAFVNAKMRGMRYALDHKDETVAYAMKILKTEDKAAMEKAFDDHYRLRLFEPDFAFSEKAVQDAQESNIKAGSQKGMLPPDKIVNLKFVEEALKKFGKYQYKK